MFIHKWCTDKAMPTSSRYTSQQHIFIKFIVLLRKKIEYNTCSILFTRLLGSSGTKEPISLINGKLTWPELEKYGPLHKNN